MAVDVEERKRNEPEPTQPGTEDLTDDALEALLSKVPPTKRQKALARLTQIGVADEQQPLGAK